MNYILSNRLYMGSASQPMLVIKYNRALLRKRKLKDVKKLVLEASGKTELEFKKISPEEMASLKEKIRARHKKHIRFEIVAYIISALTTVAFIYALYQWVKV